MIWTDELCERLVEKLNAPGATYDSVAFEMERETGEEMSRDKVRGAVRRYFARKNDTQIASIPTPSIFVVPEPSTYYRNGSGLIEEDESDSYSESRFPEPSRIAEQPVLVIEDPNVLALSDIHAPYHSAEMLDRAVHITHKYFPHVRQVLIAGDLFDFSAISNHLNNQPTTSTETDIRAGGKIARSLRAAFDHMYIGPGNHDERISKKLNSEFSMESLLCGAFGNTDPGLHITDLDYFYVGEDIIAGHPSMYSSKPTGVAAKVALMQRKNIITGHSHKVGITVSDDGEHWVVDNGHCANPDLFYYVRRRMNTFGKMGAGFTIISNGKPFVFGDAITDWSFWK